LPCGRPKKDRSTKTAAYRLSAFSFDTKGAKEKAKKKKTPKKEFRSLRRATDVSPSAHDKLLKKFDQNFPEAHQIKFRCHSSQ
jgi:hypothetical protein